MSEEQAEIHVIKCRGQVTLVRLPNEKEDLNLGAVSTIILGTGDPKLGFLYLQGEDYRLGSVFEIEITLHQMSPEEFSIKRNLKPVLM